MTVSPSVNPFPFTRGKDICHPPVGTWDDINPCKPQGVSNIKGGPKGRVINPCPVRKNSLGSAPCTPSGAGIKGLNHKITLTFKISLKDNNIQCLYYIKKQLGVGTVRSDKQGMANFIIRDKRSIETILIPIFNKYSLLTSKEFSYQKFKDAFKV
jgi:hypothetical protein